MRILEDCSAIVMTNVAIIVIPSYRVILSACSPYFRAMFTGELAESRATEVTIRDVDEQAMEQLVEFCYTAHIVVEESNVQVSASSTVQGAEYTLLQFKLFQFSIINFFYFTPRRCYQQRVCYSYKRFRTCAANS